LALATLVKGDPLQAFYKLIIQLLSSQEFLFAETFLPNDFDRSASTFFGGVLSRTLFDDIVPQFRQR